MLCFVKKIGYIFTVALIFLLYSAIFNNNIVIAKEFDISEITAGRTFPSQNSGSINAVIIRLGYKDYPNNKSNIYYNSLNDNILHSIFEGFTEKLEDYDYPFEGVSDYLETSSYGKMSMKIGEIVDIQLDGDALSYYEDDIRDAGDIINNPEFIHKFLEKVDVSKYDSDGMGGVDALYIFDVADLSWMYEAVVTNLWYEDTTNRVAYFRHMSDLTPDGPDGGFNGIFHVILRETGHLLLNLPDYYLLDDYGYSDDIGNIMSSGRWDYDAISKWNAGWLTNENVLTIEPGNNETGEVYLSPYDSDTAEGKKIVIFKCGMYYIAADYCGGINNNDVTYSTRKNGFRFYLLGGTGNVYKVFISETEDGPHQLFVENEDLENIFGRGLSITNIQTGDNPSFTYSYTHNESNDRPEVEVDIPTHEININYKVCVLDDAGNDITNDIEIDFQDISEDSVYINSYTGEERGTLKLYFLNYISHVDTKVSLSSVPEGYTESDVMLNLINPDDDNITVTSPNSNVEVIKPENSNIFEINVTLQKEQQEEPTPHSEDATESSADNTQGTEEVTEPSDNETQPTDETKESSDADKTGSADGKMTTFEEIKNNNDNEADATEANNSFSSSAKTAPQTGDRSNIPLWLTIAGASAGVAATAIIAKRKKKK